MFDPERLYESLIPYLINPSNPSPRDGNRIWSYCPAHPDGEKDRRSSPPRTRGGRSLSLSRTTGVQCFAGCEFSDIIAAFEKLGYRHDADRERKPATSSFKPWQIVAVYEYKNTDGVTVAVKARRERYQDGIREKSFLWRLPTSDTWGGLPFGIEDLPLYGAELLADSPDEIVYFTEGEKAAEACRKQGLLAVCAGCGAQRNPRIANALSVLRGRRVALWPDNDEQGAVYMAAVASMLRPIAAEILWVKAPTPFKGDAYDYFEAGGKVENLFGESDETSVEILATSSIKISKVIAGKRVEFLCSHVSLGRDELNCTLSVLFDGRKFLQRINLLSSSSRQTLARELKGYYGDYNWLDVLVEITSNLETSAKNSEPIIDIIEVNPRQKQEFLVQNTFPLGESSLIFGPGDSGKTYVALYTAFISAIGGDWLESGRWVSQTPVLWIDYETQPDGSTVRYRLERIAAGIGINLDGGIFYYRAGRGMPLANQFDQIDAFCRENGIGLVCIDSALKACGGDIRDEHAVGQYFSALQALGTTSITLAHVTKDGDNETPFGSIFWHNEPHGYIWYLHRYQTAESSLAKVIMSNKKANDGRRPEPFAIDITFSDPNGPVTFLPGEIPEAVSSTVGKSIRTLIKECLEREDELDYRDIAKTLNMEAHAIRAILIKYREFVSDDGGVKWHLR